jgi:hypothetical protein
MDSLMGLEELAQTDRRDDAAGDAIPWPDPMADEAYHGLVGGIVRGVAPYTEADDAALLINLLAGVGNIVGNGPRCYAGEDCHQLKINAVLVGETAKGRKGSSMSPVQAILRIVDRHYADWKIINGGLSTGEGLIWQIRDEITQKQPIKEKSRVMGYEDVIIDPGVADKRLLVVESEFATALKVATRQGNTLSPLIRKAWDSDILGSLTKNSPAKATGAHISIIGHITRHELEATLTECDQANGFANRFLWVCARRSKMLPDGARIPTAVLNALATRLHDVIDHAAGVGEVVRDDQAADLWRRVYPDLSAGRPGLLGAVLARAEAQVMRLACVYALLDRSAVVRPDHLMAALAVWDYCVASAAYIFGGATGDPVADRVMMALGGGPMTQTDIYNALGRHTPAKAIRDALQRLSAAGKVTCQRWGTAGRPKTVWAISDDAQKAQKAQ